MKKIILFVCLTITSFTIFSCWFTPYTPPQGPETNKGVYVMNGGAETLSVIDLEEDTVYNDVAATGTYPNQLVMRNGKLYCVNSGSANITVYERATLDSESPVSLPYLSNPMEMAFLNDSIAFVSGLISQKVYKVNMNTKTIIDTADAALGATGVAVVNDKVYLSCTGYNALTFSYDPGLVLVYNVSGLNMIDSIVVNTNPQTMVEDELGYLHVLCSGNYVSEFGTVDIIDTQSDQIISSISVGGSPGVISYDKTLGVGYSGSWGAGVVSYSENGGVLNDSGFVEGGSGVMVDDESDLWITSWGKDKVFRYDSDGVLLDSLAVGDGPQRMIYFSK